jgi:hypothetical protein
VGRIFSCTHRTLSGKARTRYRIAFTGGKGVQDNTRSPACPGALSPAPSLSLSALVGSSVQPPHTSLSIKASMTGCRRSSVRLAQVDHETLGSDLSGMISKRL